MQVASVFWNGGTEGLGRERPDIRGRNKEFGLQGQAPGRAKALNYGRWGICRGMGEGIASLEAKLIGNESQIASDK